MSKTYSSPASPSYFSPTQASISLRSPMPTSSKHSSFLPIPSAQGHKTSLPASSPKPSSSALPSVTSNAGNATSISRSITLTKSRENSMKNIRLSPRASPKASPKASLYSTSASSNPKKQSETSPMPGAARNLNNQLATDDQIRHSSTVSSPPAIHSLRRISRLPRQNILNTNRSQLASLSSMAAAEYPTLTNRRPAWSNAPSLTSSQTSAQQPRPPVTRGLTAPRRTGKAKSQQDLVYKPPQPSKLITTPVKQSICHSESDSNSPQSNQSKITLTDGDSSTQTRFDDTFSKFDSNQKIAPPNSPYALRPGDVLLAPSNDLANASSAPVPPESQQRLLILEKIQTLARNEPREVFENCQAISRLINQSELYETVQDVEKRVFENAITDIPQATLENPAQPTPTLNCSTNPFIWATQSTSCSPNPKKLHVGAIILEKLRRVSKTGQGQSFKHSLSKSISRPIKAPPLPLNYGSHNVKNAIAINPSDNPASPDDSRFSQVLGARLECMNNSTCVVTMGEQLHILPTLPFSVIEEIYRRGMRTPGLLRISGDFSRIDELVKIFESCPSSGIDLSSEDIHTLCGLFKYYLRVLPQPLFPPLLSDLLWKLCVLPDRNKHIDRVRSPQSPEFIIARYLLQLVPSRSLSLLAYVIPFLAHVPTFSENRIQDESLATMLGPAIFLGRNIGFPGLGLHPRTNTISNLVSRSGTSSQPTEEMTSLDPSKVENKNPGGMAAESTLWMMNHWKILFSEAYRAVDSKPEGAKSIETWSNPPESLPPSLQGLFPANVQRTTQHQSHAKFAESFFRTRAASTRSSILTYSSGLTGSRSSTVLEDHPSVPSPTPVHPPRQASDSDSLEFDLSRSIGLPGPESDVQRSSLIVDFPRLSDTKAAESFEINPQPEQNTCGLHGEVKECNSNRPISISFGHTVASLKHAVQEEESRERRNSQKLTKLLGDYIEGREEKINRQESIIESLIGEIGRLKTVEEEEEIEQRKSLLSRLRLDSNVTDSNLTTNSADPDQPFKKIWDFFHAVDQPRPTGIIDPCQHDPNTPHDDDRPRSESSMETFNKPVSNELIEWNFEPATGSSQETSFADSETSQVTGSVKRGSGGDQMMITTGLPFNQATQSFFQELQSSNLPFSSVSPAQIHPKIKDNPFDLINHDHHLDHRYPALNHLNLDIKPLILDGDLRSLDSRPGNSGDCCSEGKACQVEINRLRAINAKLTLKLKNIESIIAADA